MFCPNCGTKIEKGVRFCPNCGTHIEEFVENGSKDLEQISNSNNTAETVTNAQPLISTDKGFFAKLKDGDFGLAKTFWLYWFLVNIVVNILTKAINNLGGLLIIMIPYIIYAYFALNGIWNASNRYKGSKVWAILAKILVVLASLSIVAFILLLLVALTK